MNFKNIMKKMILILGILGISVTSFAFSKKSHKKNKQIVYVRKEPSRKIKKQKKQIVYVRKEPSLKVKKNKKQKKQIVYIKKEPSRKHIKTR
ncbi:hypothetical protein [Leptotrichia alba]|uniref:Uncharacterized protein n=1 Tax=Leptotrichia alba TaxID=3239304 RepID=A0AB39V2T7_9FUSO